MIGGFTQHIVIHYHRRIGSQNGVRIHGVAGGDSQRLLAGHALHVGLRGLPREKVFVNIRRVTTVANLQLVQ
jgi:hypothetical protein